MAKEIANSDKETSTPSYLTMNDVTILEAPKRMILSWPPSTFSANVTEYDVFFWVIRKSIHSYRIIKIILEILLEDDVC